CRAPARVDEAARRLELVPAALAELATAHEPRALRAPRAADRRRRTRTHRRLTRSRATLGVGCRVPRLDPDQVVDGTHTRELTSCTLGGVSVRFRLDLSVEDHAPVANLHPDRVAAVRRQPA